MIPNMVTPRSHRPLLRSLTALALILALVGCGDDAASSSESGASDASATETSAGSGASATSSSSSGAGQTGTGTAATATAGTSTGALSMTNSDSLDPKFDVGLDSDAGETEDPPAPSCKVVGEMDGVPPCEETAPPDSFEPSVQWSYTPEGAEINAAVTPLVANLTDDNDDGEVDLCDVPDIVVVVYSGGGEVDASGSIHVLDGETGALHYVAAVPVVRSVTPAIGDIDNDGEPEIISVRKLPGQLNTGPIVAINGRDGSVEWEGSDSWYMQYGGALGLADLDADGDVEVYAGTSVADHTGAMLWTGPDQGAYAASTAADLDGDGDLEIIEANVALHHDGTTYYQNNQVESKGYAQVADLDDDPEPEVLITAPQGLSLLEHDGTAKYVNLRPTGVPAGGNNWRRPATVHDFDGDGLAEYAMSSQQFYTVYEGDASIVWSSPVADGSGTAAGTAFDFIGDGLAEAMYADEQSMFIFDDQGATLLMTPRKSWTGIEYPVVADVDNDGSAEIVVVSNDAWSGMLDAPTVQVIRDIEDRWVPTRRIFNQHTYHITNVREDGTIPQHEAPHWESFNTFRTNVQSEGGMACKPEPPG